MAAVTQPSRSSFDELRYLPSEGSNLIPRPEAWGSIGKIENLEKRLPYEELLRDDVRVMIERARFLIPKDLRVQEREECVQVVSSAAAKLLSLLSKESQGVKDEQSFAWIGLRPFLGNEKCYQIGLSVCCSMNFTVDEAREIAQRHRSPVLEESRIDRQDRQSVAV